MDLRYRKGYFASESHNPTDKERQSIVDEVLASPLNATAIRIMANAKADPAKPGDYHVGVSFDPNDLYFEQGESRWVASVQMVVHLDSQAASEGKAETMQFNVTPERLGAVLSKPVISEVVVHTDKASDQVRVALVDRNSGAAGSVRLKVGK